MGSSMGATMQVSDVVGGKTGVASYGGSRQNGAQVLKPETQQMPVSWSHKRLGDVPSATEGSIMEATRRKRDMAGTGHNNKVGHAMPWEATSLLIPS